MISRRCTTCDGTADVGYYAVVHGYPEWQSERCPDCEHGWQRDPHETPEMHEAVTLVRARCPKHGFVRMAWPVSYWDLIDGYLGQCPECGTSLSVPREAVELMADYSTGKEEAA